MLTGEAKEKVIAYFQNLKNKSQEEGVPLKSSNLKVNYSITPWGPYLEVTHTKPYEPSDNDLMDKYKTLAKVENEYCETRANLVPTLQEGNPYSAITARTISQGEETVITHKQGEVILVDFWATWCGPCIGAMNHNFEMIEKNFDKWNGRVRFIGISLVEERDEVTEFLKKKGWDKFETIFEQYASMESEGKDFTGLYGVEGIPHVALVDKFGVIRYIGHPSTSPSLEERINSLLEESEAKITSEQTSTSLENYDEMKKALDSLQKVVEENTTAFGELKYTPKLLLSYNGVYKLNEDWTDLTLSTLDNAGLRVELRQPQYDQFVQALNKEVSNYESFPWLKKDIKKLETFDITPGTTCNKCNENIPAENAQYYCHWCKISICENCFEAAQE